MKPLPPVSEWAEPYVEDEPVEGEVIETEKPIKVWPYSHVIVGFAAISIAAFTHGWLALSLCLYGLIQVCAGAWKLGSREPRTSTKRMR